MRSSATRNGFTSYGVALRTCTITKTTKQHELAFRVMALHCIMTTAQATRDVAKIKQQQKSNKKNKRNDVALHCTNVPTTVRAKMSGDC
jgi:hypothetical protein